MTYSWFHFDYFFCATICRLHQILSDILRFLFNSPTFHLTDSLLQKPNTPLLYRYCLLENFFIALLSLWEGALYLLCDEFWFSHCIRSENAAPPFENKAITLPSWSLSAPPVWIYLFGRHENKMRPCILRVLVFCFFVFFAQFLLFVFNLSVSL